MIQKLTPNDQVIQQRLLTFPTKIQESCSIWRSELENAKTNEANLFAPVWSERLEEVLSAASLLGLGRLARLCRAVHVCLDKGRNRVDQLEKSAHIAIRRAMEVILEQIETEGVGPLPVVRVLIDDLRDAFELNEKLFQVPFYLPDHHDNVSHGEPASVVITPQHNDIEVYRSAWIDALDKCTQEESWLASQLATLAEDLACGLRSERPSVRLMNVIRGHRFFHQVDRVCLAGRVNLSNQLVVVDACLSERCPENTLRKGYSCFVNPNGSLFKMKPGSLRIFGDSARVLSSFRSEQKPVQRSIALVAEQGLRSGLCIPVGRGDEIQGFLFLNSMAPDLFQDITKGYAPLVSLFALVATIALDANGFSLDRGTQKLMFGDSIPNHSHRFEVEQFRGYLETAWNCLTNSNLALELEIVNTNLDFLYLPTLVTTTIAEIFAQLQLADANKTQSLNLCVSQEHAMILMSIRHSISQHDSKAWIWLEKMIRVFNAKFPNRPVQVSLADKAIELRFPYEPTLPGHRGLLYSIVY